MNLGSSLSYGSRWLATNTRKKRNSIEIAADMLGAARDGVRKTKIMYRANLSYGLLETYLHTLIQEGLLEGANENGVYRITSKGSIFLKEFKEFKKLQGLYGDKISSLKRLLLVK